jgi:FAD-dependent oxidoreductase family protein
MLRSLCFLCSLLFLPLWPARSRAADEPVYDLVIYGGTSGGVAAGVQVRRMGKTAVIVEPGKHLGGLTTGGLGATDIGNKGAIGGISREFYQRIKRHYAEPAAWKYEKPDDYRSGRGSEVAQEDAMWTFEPHVAEKLMDELCAEAGIVVVKGERLDLTKGVEKKDGRIVSIRMESGRTFRGRMFVDAAYEGDLMAKAGVSYTVGREANSQYGETLSGVQVKNATKHQFIKAVDPYVKPGDPASGLLSRVEAGPLGADGQADRRVQAYNYRLCATDQPANRRPWPKPSNYDERRYEILLRNFEAGDLRVPWNPVLMPNRKTDSNNNFAFSTDNIGMNYDYPDGDYATREKIIREHIDYQQGLLWTLANHPRVPAKIREHFQTWGLAKDEFVDTDNWPHQLYVREARRMVSGYVMTQHHCQGRAVAEDSVGLAAYTMDSHNVLRYVDAEGHVRNEGDVQVGGFAPYPISYRSIVPKASECQNLFVPVCLAATHISYGSIRMEPVFMVLGQSSATAAAMAIDAGTSVQKVDYAKLRERLLADKQVLVWTGPKPASAGGIDPAKLPGLVLDDDQAEKTGDWSKSTSIGGYVGSQYLHDNNEQKGEKSATYRFALKEPGLYEVRLAYTANPNRATNVPVVIHHTGGQTKATVNEKVAPAIDRAFHSLGAYKFDKEAIVVITNAGTDGYVVIDAVQLRPVTD